MSSSQPTRGLTQATFQASLDGTEQGYPLVKSEAVWPAMPRATSMRMNCRMRMYQIPRSWLITRTDSRKRSRRSAPSNVCGGTEGSRSARRKIPTVKTKRASSERTIRLEYGRQGIRSRCSRLITIFIRILRHVGCYAF